MQEIFKASTVSSNFEELVQMRNQRLEMLKRIVNEMSGLLETLQRDIPMMDEKMKNYKKDCEFVKDKA